jgi:predicted component of type VI protein secretion system
VKGLILARIERIRHGHSDRSLVHAVAEGLDYKIEVPTDEVASLGTGEGHMLVLSWSIHASPSVTVTAEAPPSAATPVRVDAQFMSMMNRGTDGASATPAPSAPVATSSTPAPSAPIAASSTTVATASPTTSTASSPASVDEQFMTLMNRGKSGAPAPAPATSLSGPERQLASLLGLPTRG